MTKPEKVPGGWRVGDQVFRGRTARERAYRASRNTSAPSANDSRASKNPVTNASRKEGKQPGIEDWPLKSSPADYLDRYPNGPKSKLARQILTGRSE